MTHRSREEKRDETRADAKTPTTAKNKFRLVGTPTDKGKWRRLQIATASENRNMSKLLPKIPDTFIASKILLLRGKRVMIDSDLAELYGVSTKRLNQQMRRNIQRFPEDFMFQLTPVEKEDVVANCDHLRNLKFSTSLPFVFTEHGAVMLASVLNSDQAIQMNIQIVRIFTQMRELALTHKDILVKLLKIEKKVTEHDKDLKLLFDAVKNLLNEPKKERVKIGYKVTSGKKNTFNKKIK